MQQFFIEKCLQQRNKVFLAVFAIAVGHSGYADSNNSDLITIIGPDGLPMVVPMQKDTQPRNESKTSTQKDSEKKSWFRLFSKDSDKVADNTENAVKSESVKQLETSNDTESKVAAVDVVAPQVPQKSQDAPKNIQSVKTEVNTQPSIVSKAVSVSDVVHPKVSQQTDIESVQQQNTVVDSKIEKVQTSIAEPSEEAPYRIIDGEKYYQAEYLESKEFNLEDRKRFYQIPSGVDGVSSGSANWEVLERQKGVDMTVFRGVEQKPHETVVALGTDYHVISKAELAQAIPVQCVDDKAIRKSKNFGRNDSVSFFPRAPFNEEFDFELLDFDKEVQNLKITSYASNNKSPTYYWPVAIFLDQNGCVLEGASAFHTQTNPATMLQSSSIDGVIHVPKDSQYLMLSALEYGADVPQLKLSNEGQIKLTVLR
ncbi:MAG: putative pilus assembly protein FilE [Pseudomonadota bacterium]|nr:putative pilus assembly protein FilE [Pseudomonadota bacterium]